MKDIFRLDGKVAIITGGLGGIGSYTSELLAEYGANIVIIDILPEDKAADLIKKIEDLGCKIIYIKADTRIYDDVVSVKNKILSIFNKSDILFNCTGSIKVCQFENMTDDIWDDCVETSVKSTYYCCREIGKIMITQRSGSIINMSSIAAIIGLPRGNTHLAMAKGGIQAFTRTLAVEWAKYGIRINSIVPAQVATPPLLKLMQENETVARQIIDSIPMRRIAQPQDIAAGVLYLASGASAFVTGHTLVIDGGTTIA